MDRTQPRGASGEPMHRPQDSMISSRMTYELASLAFAKFHDRTGWSLVDFEALESARRLAVIRGGVDAMRSWVSLMGPYATLFIDEPGPTGPPKTWATMLCVASSRGRCDEIRYLLGEGADPNAVPNGAFYAPLHYCVSSGRAEAAAVLVDSGADVNAQWRFGRSALMTAALSGECAVLRTLLKRGAVCDLRDDSSYTAEAFTAIDDHKDAEALLAEVRRVGWWRSALSTDVSDRACDWPRDCVIVGFDTCWRRGCLASCSEPYARGARGGVAATGSSVARARRFRPSSSGTCSGSGGASGTPRAKKCRSAAGPVGEPVGDVDRDRGRRSRPPTGTGVEHWHA